MLSLLWSSLIFSFLLVSFSFFVCLLFYYILFFFFFKQKTAYEMRISDWSSDVCSSDLVGPLYRGSEPSLDAMTIAVPNAATHAPTPQKADPTRLDPVRVMNRAAENAIAAMYRLSAIGARKAFDRISRIALIRSEEHTSELQSLMRNSYAGFCLKKKK